MSANEPNGDTGKTAGTPPPAAAPAPSDLTWQKNLNSGFTLIGGMIVGASIGYAIDAVFGSVPVATLICGFLFLLAALYQVVKEYL